MAKIKKIEAREILASGGKPTVEAEIELESGITAKASVPYGASAGKHEVVVLVDGDMKRYGGKGVLKAVKNVEEIIGPEIVGMEAEPKRIDEKMIAMDGSKNKGKLGGNAILAVSMAVARAGAMERKIPLYEYLRQVYGVDDGGQLPRPMVVMIEGGKHADKTTDIQEYLVVDLENQSVADDIRMEMEIYMKLEKILQREGLGTNVGNEGAFAPSGIVSNEKPLEYLVEAIGAAGYKAGKDAGLAIDAAASEFFEDGKYNLRLENRKVEAEEMINIYEGWVKKYPMVSVEDGLDEDDWENWIKMSERLGEIAIIADDLTATNTERWQKAIKMKAANAILIKLNQAGTVSETVECCMLAKKHGLMTAPSHRGGGETNDTFMVDLAVAVGSEYIKVGPTRGERVVKYNRLMEIERELK